MAEYSFQWLTDKVLPPFFSDVSKIQGSEHNYAALLYHHLLLAGLSCDRVCREMYTEGLTTQRPDITIFSKEINGRFSHYLNGDTNKSNTNLKIKHIQALIEIKGGCAREKQALDDIKKLDKDVEKLKKWQTHFHQGDYIFLAINLRGFKGELKREEIQRIGSECQEGNISFIYFMQDDRQFRLWQPNKPEQIIPILSPLLQV